jgi:hypothetical protein
MDNPNHQGYATIFGDMMGTADLQIEKRSMEMLFVRGDSVILVSAIEPSCLLGANHTDITHTTVN